MYLDISPFIDILASYPSDMGGRKSERQYKQASFTLYTNLVAELVAELVDLMCCYLLLVTEALINFKEM